MDFDFDLITVPFRMQPGLRRLGGEGPRLTPLDPAGRLFTEKRAVVEAGVSRQVVAGFDPGPALRAIAARGGIDTATPELAFEEDFAVLDGESGTLPWLCVCVPSHWQPEQKLGLDFATLHAPVADNQLLVAASKQLVGLATGGDCWERFVWTISPSGRYDQHPGRHARAPWPASGDLETFASQCWFRAERQCFFPVGQGTQQAVFTIRVMLQPLAEAMATASRAQRLHDSLASMSPAVLEYKGLTGGAERLLRWLEQVSSRA